ncbi:hypothetical protein BG011_000956 [Mortierella polycephala]|uniref:FAD-binding PCMH-type domain-containing protein n=1 Tax=Mortierella polycephala TaxID=41804 RepID=A0A9P6PJP6_9FUNG|nr:hypothetical protein BG011_000956 [Mortierella polycephala]
MIYTAALRSLALLFALLPLSLADEVSNSPNVSQRRCRCLLSQPCWPSESSWQTLNQAIGGRLIATKPAAYNCHDPHYDDAACQEVQKGYFDVLWRETQPGAMLRANWEVVGDQGCRGFNKTAPCFQGAVPLYSVNATSAEDVQNAVRFASKSNIRLVVKNTGHDFIGRSTGASSLSVWVHYMKGIAFDKDFVPKGATNGTKGTGVIILGAGVQWVDAYKAADERSVIVIGGFEQTVGTSGGYCQGGGHSLLSPMHGLCVDNVLQYKVVTADGKLKVANAYQNKDLFWALRGGGGGTFGVVVEAIYKTHSALDNINFANFIIHYNTTEARRSILNRFFSHQIKWSKTGWSGYGIVQNNAIIFQYYLPNSDINAANASIAVFFDHAKTFEDVKIEGQIKSYPSFYTCFMDSTTTENRGAGMNALIGSRLIPSRNFETPNGVSQLTDTLLETQERLRFVNPQGIFVTNLIAGGAVANGTSVETSVVPAWRKALMHIWVTAGWGDDTTLAEQDTIARSITSTMGLLRKLSPGSGAYVNEADPNEPNWQTSFFGSNYPRLKAIKDKVDPEGLFTCRNCVGSEDWTKDFNCPRR